MRLVSDERPGTVYELRVLGTWLERLRGLLGTGPDAAPVMLVRCRSIHTFGMGYALDVALVGERGKVLAVRRALEPRTTLSHPRACCVLERPASAEPWVEEGEHLRVTSLVLGFEGACAAGGEA
ncbi:DUF192 domain-containing protein [Olsenella sp. DSM 107455]|uniref:DUF192 domain-containing protein n=1 Tax=Thermophilibacter gallinarum TaxID=2779357 RepID=A0ABR9QRC3_9ACTN|nr:DUF192 domain-containing protein [Thermophilibacter gallinarum]